MKIEKYEKNRNGMYILTLDNYEKIKIHEDLILKYELLLNKNIDDELLKKILKENQVYEVYGIALKYLNKSLRSKLELSNYLVKKGYSNELIKKTIELLSKQGYLNDMVYASSFVHDKILLSSYGPNKIHSELEKLGIEPNVISKALEPYDENLERTRIEKIITKRIKSNHNKGSNLLKKKIYVYLLNLGYSSSIINSCLEKENFDDKDLYKKEYQKLYDKLSKKYSGKELEYKIKQKLYQKGFNNCDF